MPNLTIEEFYKHIEVTTGMVAGGPLRVGHRPDPEVPLTRPLQSYQDRIFFYAGLLYGFCRLDASLTERFREASGRDIDTQQHTLEHPVMTVRGFPDFTKTKVSRLLQSCPASDHVDLLDFITSQVVVDRARSRVWRVQMTTCVVPDPFAAQLATGHNLIVLYPQTHSFEYRPIASSGLLLRAPEVQYFDRQDPAFKLDTDKYLKKE